MHAVRSAPLFAALFLPALALAQDFPGEHVLEGRYSTQRATSVALSIEQASDGTLSVTRVGRLVGQGFQHLPAFTWRSARVIDYGQRLFVVYPVRDRAGLVGGLAGGAAQINVFYGIYWRDGERLVERVINTTRYGFESGWGTISTRGDALIDAPSWLADVKRDYELGLHSNDRFEPLTSADLSGPAGVELSAFQDVASANGGYAAAGRARGPGLAVVIDTVYADGGEVMIFDATGRRLLAKGTWEEDGSLSWEDAQAFLAQRFAERYWDDGLGPLVFFDSEQAWRDWLAAGNTSGRWLYPDRVDNGLHKFIVGAGERWSEWIQVDPRTSELKVLVRN